jgi:hypothetical protein
MSFNGSGTFQINSSGQPPVAATAITVAAHVALTGDLATGLSTCITKDGQTTTTAVIPFAAGLSTTSITNSTGLASGAYSPTLTNTTNLSASSCSGLVYYRIGNIVHVEGQTTVTPTAASNTATELGISLAVASNLAASTDLVGFCISTDSTIVEYGFINGDSSNDRAKVQFKAGSTNLHGLYVSFSYVVI